MSLDLPLASAALLLIAVLAYVLLDGFDLGIGILFPFLRSPQDRDTASASIAPVWDGNETWLILGGTSLLALFPMAYAVLLTALYAPVVAMLIGLVVRGAAFEYRKRMPEHKDLWDHLFHVGSLVATFTQGVLLGALIQGIRVSDRQYAGGWWDWLTPFSVFTGLSLVVGYALLGATWLYMKTRGTLQRRARLISWIAAWGTVGLIGIVSVWTPLMEPAYLARWLDGPFTLLLLPAPVLMLTCVAVLFRGLHRHHERAPFLSALGVFVLCFLGLCLTFYPDLVPPSVSIEDAAAPATSMIFVLIGAAILLPILLSSTVFTYFIFRGKVGPGEGNGQ